MFKHIRTSKENKEIVGRLTRRLGLGTENIIARIALVTSLNQGKKLALDDIQNSSGKEYSRDVLFGDKLNLYVGMVCMEYGLHQSDKDIPKYIKLHIDDGLEQLNQELSKRPNVEGFDFLTEKIVLNLS
jgi:DNA sulfur modification protein DndE